jgi:ATP synthase protein I
LSARNSGDIGGMSPWGIGLRVGVELVSALVVAVAIGYGLDYLLGTRPILTAVFVLLGGAAGILNVWRLFAPRPTRGPKVRDGGR